MSSSMGVVAILDLSAYKAVNWHLRHRIFCAVDKDFTIIDVGESCLSVAGYSASELQGAFLDKLFATDMIEAVRTAVGIAFSGRTTSIECDIMRRGEIGEHVHLVFSGAVIAGALRTVRLYVRDVPSTKPDRRIVPNMIATHVPLPVILYELASALESEYPQYIACITYDHPDADQLLHIETTKMPLQPGVNLAESDERPLHCQAALNGGVDQGNRGKWSNRGSLGARSVEATVDQGGLYGGRFDAGDLAGGTRQGIYSSGVFRTKDIGKEGTCSACAWLKTRYGQSVCWSRALLTPHGESLGRFSVYGPSKTDERHGSGSEQQTTEPVSQGGMARIEGYAARVDDARLDNAGVTAQGHTADVTSVISSATDLTEEIFTLYSAMAELAIWSNYYEVYLAHKEERDELTDLYNFHKFSHVLSTVVKSSERTTLFYVDVDNFEFVNQGIGHNVGNKVLQAVAKRLEEWCKPSLVPGRIAGDAFGVILPGVTVDAALKLAEEVAALMRQPIPLDEGPVYVTVSIGMSLGGTPEELIDKAFQGSLEAKRLGGDTISFFNEYRDAASLRLFELMRDIHTALEKNQLDVYYQPRVDPFANEMVAAEALLRWHHPDWGTIPPGEFIGMLEQHGLMGSIEHWIVERVCQDLKAWSEQGLTLVPISVNFCPQQLMRPDVVAWVVEVLRRYGIDVSLIEIELTERQTLPRKDKVTQVFQEFKNAGIRILLDDFAGGATPLSYFNRTLVSAIKVEKEMTDELLTNEDVTLVLSSLIDLTHKLGIRVIAEGVENERQANLLTHMHCDEIQGYLYSAPVPAATFASMLRKCRIGSDDVAVADAADDVTVPDVADVAFGPMGMHVQAMPAVRDTGVAGTAARSAVCETGATGTGTRPAVRETGAAGTDRRRHPRIDLPSPLIGRITISRIQHRQVKVGWSAILVSNISPEGLEFASSLRLPADRHTVLRVQINISGEVDVSANLLWMHEHQPGIFKYGAAFVMDDANRRSIEHLCASLAEPTCTNQMLPDGSVHAGSVASFFRVPPVHLRDEG